MSKNNATLKITTTQEGFQILRSLYADSEVVGGEMIDSMFAEEEFDDSIPAHILYGAVQLFLEWDADEDDQMLYSKGNDYRFPDGEFVPKGMRVGVISDGVTWAAKEGCILLDRGILSEKATAIYQTLLSAKTIKIYTNGGYSYLCDDFSLEPVEEIMDARIDDENPIVFSIYSTTANYEKYEFHFDYADFVNAKIDDSGKGFVMPLEDGSEATVLVLETSTQEDNALVFDGISTETLIAELCKRGTIEITSGNFKVITNFQATEPFVGVYFANGDGFDNLATYVDKDGTLTVEHDGEEMALAHEENGTDFILANERCYITVNGLTVHIKKDDEGVAVDIWPLHEEDGEPIASTWALYSEGKEGDEKKLEKFECMDCGCYFMVESRDGFCCPNCESKKESVPNYNLYAKEIQKMLKDAEAGDYLQCLREDNIWNELLNYHTDIYPYERSFDEYDTEWFEKNSFLFVDFLKQVIARETTNSLEAEEEVDTEYISLHDSRFPFIISMYDPCDPGHTRGIPDYFADQINIAIMNGGDKDALEAEKALILGLNCDRIVVGNEDEEV